MDEQHHVSCWSRCGLVGARCFPQVSKICNQILLMPTTRENNWHPPPTHPLIFGQGLVKKKNTYDRKSSKIHLAVYQNEDCATGIKIAKRKNNVRALFVWIWIDSAGCYCPSTNGNRGSNTKTKLRIAFANGQTSRSLTSIRRKNRDRCMEISCAMMMFPMWFEIPDVVWETPMKTKIRIRKNETLTKRIRFSRISWIKDYSPIPWKSFHLCLLEIRSRLAYWSWSTFLDRV